MSNSGTFADDWKAEDAPELRGGLKFKPLEKAPEFSLPNQDGKLMALKDFAGSLIVLQFYNSEEAGAGRRLVESYIANAEEIKALGGTVLFISQDSVVTHKQFCEQHRVSFPMLSDADRKVSRKYETVLGPNIVRSTVVVGPEGQVLRVWQKLDAQEARDVPQQVVDFLRECARFAE